MDGRDHAIGQIGCQPNASLFCYAELLSHQGLCGGRAEEHKDTWFYDLYFGRKPGKTRPYLARLWFFMQPPLAPRLPFEMLHGVGYVGLFAVDTGFGKGLVKEPPGRPDERVAAQVLFVSGLFAYE